MFGARVLAPAFALLTLLGAHEAAAACPKGQKRIEHEIAAGDTLSAIAVKYETSMRAIEGQNPGLTKDSVLKLGKKLRVCVAGEAAAKTDAKAASKTDAKASAKGKDEAAKKCGKGRVFTAYTVQKGDNLGKISERYAITDAAILEHNPKIRRRKDNLQVGEELAICVDEKRQSGAAECGHRTPIFEHIVLPGDNPGRIAGRYGVTVKDLYRWNRKLKERTKFLQYGEKVRVCPEIAPRVLEKITHSVQKGENLGAIALRYDLTLRELVDYQDGKVKADEMLAVGTPLVIWREGPIAPGFGGEYEDDSGVLRQGVQLAAGQHYMVKTPSHAWGTAKTVRLIQTAVAAYRRKISKAPEVHVGDISRKGGGKFPPHRSHQHGRDVDVGYVLKGDGADESRFLHANKSNLDLERTWALIKAFIDTDEVRYIFMDYDLQRLVYEHAKSTGVSAETLDALFQYPRGKRRSYGLIRHWRNHVNHFHVRFRE